MTRGEVFWADLGIPFGSEPGFIRPVLVVQADSFNRSKISTVIVLPLTTNLALEDAPGNVFLEKEESKLPKDSVIVVSQLTVLDRKRLNDRIVKLDKDILERVNAGLALILELDRFS